MQQETGLEGEILWETPPGSCSRSLLWPRHRVPSATSLSSGTCHQTGPAMLPGVTVLLGPLVTLHHGARKSPRHGTNPAGAVPGIAPRFWQHSSEPPRASTARTRL